MNVERVEKAKKVIWIVVLNFMPVLFSIICLPLWIAETKYKLWSMGTISLVSMAVQFIIAPIFLLILNINYINKKVHNIVFAWILSITSVFISANINFFSWGYTTGRMSNPDVETLMIINAEKQFPITVLSVGFLIYYIVKLKMDRVERKQ